MANVNNYLHSIAPKDPARAVGDLIENRISTSIMSGALVGAIAGGAALNYHIRRRRTKNGKIVIEKVRKRQ